MRLSLLIGLMLAAGPALASPAGPVAKDGPIVKDGVEVTILPSAGPTGGIVEVTLDVEARSDAAAARLKFRSMRGVTAIDCRLGANRFIKADAYPEANLRGDVSPRVVSGEWVQPAAESFMLAVTERVCGAAPAVRPTTTAASGPLPIVRLGTDSAPAPAPASAPSSAAAPTTTPPARLAMAIAPKPALAAPPPREIRAKADGRGVAQVAASPTAQGAQRVLDRLHALITPPLTGSVEPATVNNAAVFRASVAGFVSLGDAQAFCARAAAVSKTCWVHWKAAPPAKAGHP